MRDDTKEIADALDEAADLFENNEIGSAQGLLGEIFILLTKWVERHLSP
ncbi:hypothetical protein KAR91_60460 [Candidatus Pacearchaeota archaeon]|nr:hypothetical protein [Candidatus Pacearchaeota archaeon]